MYCDRFAIHFIPNSTVKPSESKHTQSLGCPEEECIENVMLTVKELEYCLYECQ